MVVIKDCFKGAVTFEFSTDRFIQQIIFSVSNVSGTILNTEGTRSLLSGDMWCCEQVGFVKDGNGGTITGVEAELEPWHKVRMSKESFKKEFRLPPQDQGRH